MCQMHPSARGSCVGVLCRLAEWEERQVNTWCQRKRRSPYLSFFFFCLAAQVKFEYTALFLAVFSRTIYAFSPFYALVYVYN